MLDRVLVSFVGVAGIYACTVADDHRMIEARIEQRGSIVRRAGVVDLVFFCLWFAERTG